MNRRQFLQAVVVIPTSLAFVKVSKVFGARGNCSECLPKRLYSRQYPRIVQPTSVTLERFEVKETSVIERLISWLKHGE
jgi:hypothetical protein